MFSIIAAIGKNWELGKGGKLVFRIKDDMKFFKDTTSGHKIVMGRRTWESLAGKLPNRTNIVLSTHDMDGPDEVVHDMQTFIENNKDTDEEIFVIGGGSVYMQFLPYASKIYLTEVDAEDLKADAFFPEFDKSKYDKTIIREGKENDLAFKISLYQLK
ncbi:MAG: dihydrofolate reductase [Candidatus Saccharibacteria bacterium]|nr:dihydrofolate reductase [Candidatus Saccharibacteria bacterium]